MLLWNYNQNHFERHKMKGEYSQRNVLIHYLIILNSGKQGRSQLNPFCKINSILSQSLGIPKFKSQLTMENWCHFASGALGAIRVNPYFNPASWCGSNEFFSSFLLTSVWRLNVLKTRMTKNTMISLKFVSCI